METKLNILVFIALLAATLHGSKAQTTHVVGDALGWLVPPSGAVAYTSWATSRTFNVGDVLVFNFTTGSHDVAEVSSAAFDACNTTAPLSSTTIGPANITLRTAGAHFYICTFTRHCNLGQKLAINVSGAASTPPPAAAPQPSSSPVPISAPTTSPLSAPTPAPRAATPAPSPSSGRPSPSPSSNPAPGPSSSTVPPSSSTTPSTPDVTAPPPPNSAPSFTGAALPVTLWSIALAFFY